MSNVKYAYILSTGGCIHFLENSGHFWRSQGNLREFFSTTLVDTMMLQIGSCNKICCLAGWAGYWQYLSLKPSSLFISDLINLLPTIMSPWTALSYFIPDLIFTTMFHASFYLYPVSTLRNFLLAPAGESKMENILITYKIPNHP